MTDGLDGIAEVVRGRILRGLRAGTLHSLDRLPSARDFARELGTDHRLVLAALRLLADEGLVELRPRGGLYVAARPPDERGRPTIQEPWLTELLTQSLARDLPPDELHELLRSATESLRLRAVVIAETGDEGYGLCRELTDDFGLEGESVLAEEVRDVTPLPIAVRRADLLVTTSAHAVWVRELGIARNLVVQVITLRPDLTTGDFALLLRQPVYALVASQRFGEILREFFAHVDGVENLRILVHGEDDLSVIPDDAPVYVTQRVRRQLTEPMRGQVLPPARTISGESARALFAFIVRENVAAMRRHQTPSR